MILMAVIPASFGADLSSFSPVLETASAVVMKSHVNHCFAGLIRKAAGSI